MQALHLAGAVAGVEHRYFDARQPGKACQRRFAGVAGGGHQNLSGTGVAQYAFCLYQQPGHQLKRIVLEGTGRAVPQFKRIKPLLYRADISGPAGKPGAVHLLRGAKQKLRRIFLQKQAQHLSRRLRIAEAVYLLRAK